LRVPFFERKHKAGFASRNLIRQDVFFGIKFLYSGADWCQSFV
jgi:hypothetical protein